MPEADIKQPINAYNAEALAELSVLVAVLWFKRGCRHMYTFESLVSQLWPCGKAFARLLSGRTQVRVLLASARLSLNVFGDLWTLVS